METHTSRTTEVMLKKKILLHAKRLKRTGPCVSARGQWMNTRRSCNNAKRKLLYARRIFKKACVNGGKGNYKISRLCNIITNSRYYNTHTCVLRVVYTSSRSSGSRRQRLEIVRDAHFFFFLSLFYDDTKYRCFVWTWRLEILEMYRPQDGTKVGD